MWISQTLSGPSHVRALRAHSGLQTSIRRASDLWITSGYDMSGRVLFDYISIGYVVINSLG
jgi:hypothetical protein